MKISPGPWVAAYIGSSDWHIMDASDEHVASVPCVGPRGDRHEGDNARLIAASPELLEALRFTAELAHQGSGASAHHVIDSEPVSCKICAARALIRRIEGEE